MAELKEKARRADERWNAKPSLVGGSTSGDVSGVLEGAKGLEVERDRGEKDAAREIR